MTLPGNVQPAASDLSGFDADTVLSSSTAKKFYDSGYRFCIRYLSLHTPQASGDLSYNEALAILQAGLALMAVQHVDANGWSPSASLGNTHGLNAAANAQEVGLPAGVNIWCDLEGVKQGTPSASVIDYCNSWYAAVAAAGYIPGLYVGANAGLDGYQLYSNLKFQHYWKSASNVPDVSVRGYQLVQYDPDVTVNGIEIDKNKPQTDNKGGQALWLVLQSGS